MSYPLLNLALRQPTQASSVAAEEGVDAAAAVNGRKQALASYRSLVEENAWWQVDLGRVTGVGRMQLWAAERAPLRGVPFLPFAIQASHDAIAWTTLAQLHCPYGGASTQRPAVLEFAHGVTARFIRVQGIGHGCLQFDELEVFRFVPYSRDSAVSSIEPRASDELDGVVLKPRHDAGYFSVMSVILAEILHYRRSGLETTSIDDRGVFKQFKDGAGDSMLDVVVDRLSWGAVDEAGMARKLPNFGARGRYSPNSMAYKTMDHEALQYFVARYFGPSNRVKALQAEWAEKYNLEIQKSFVVYYRGTDKVTEMKPASFEAYADEVERVTRGSDSQCDIIVQTDQQQFLDFMLSRFPDRVRFVYELPTTSGTKGMHFLNLDEEFGISRQEFGLRMFTVISWLSQARWLLTASGNVGFWLALMRGHARGLYQFHPHTQALIEPDPAPPN